MVNFLHVNRSLIKLFMHEAVDNDEVTKIAQEGEVELYFKKKINSFLKIKSIWI